MLQKSQLEAAENGTLHFDFQISGLYSSSGILNGIFQKLDGFLY